MYLLLNKKLLRENHSGMETEKLALFQDFANASCVRTIVVWKHEVTSIYLKEICELRENHSGMETSPAISISLAHLGLRENHSGMETRLELTAIVSDSRCVRTIVVWKLLFFFTIV